MMKSHESFRNMTALRQYEYCLTIGRIAIQSVRKSLRQFTISGDKSEVFDYAIDEGFSEPEIIDITNQRKLLS